MADQNHHQVVFGLGLARHRSQDFVEVRAAGLLSRQGIHAKITAGILEQLVQIAGQTLEALLVVRLAT